MREREGPGPGSVCVCARAALLCAVSTVWCCGQARGHACEAPPIIPLLTDTHRPPTDPTASRQLLRLCSHAPQQAYLTSHLLTPPRIFPPFLLLLASLSSPLLPPVSELERS